MAGRRHEAYVAAQKNAGRTVEPYDRGATQYRAPSDPVYVERNERPKSFGEVRAQWAENVGGGLGAAVVWAAVSVVVHGALYRVGPYLPLFPLFLEPWPNPARVGVAAFVVGALVFGGLMFLRSSLDELVEAGEWNALNQDYDAVEAELADVRAKWQDKYDALREDYDLLKAEYNLLVQRKAAGRVVDVHPEVVLPVQTEAQHDAIELLRRAYGKQRMGRNYMVQQYGWTEGRWDAARDYLVDAKVLSYTGERGNIQKWIYDDLGTALLKVSGRQVDRVTVMSS